MLQSDRRTRMLAAARVCFLDRGFVRTTISDILAQSGGSRATLYDEFGSKEGLFAAIVAAIIEGMDLPNLAGGPPEVVLPELALAYLQWLMEPEALALYRVAMGESAHVRRLGPMLFAAGPTRASAALAERLAAWNDDGALQIANPARAATLFFALVEGDLHRGALLWSKAPTEEEIAAHVTAACELFLRGSGIPSRDQSRRRAA